MALLGDKGETEDRSLSTSKAMGELDAPCNHTVRPRIMLRQTAAGACGSGGTSTGLRASDTRG